jgi:hypothetical protein
LPEKLRGVAFSAASRMAPSETDTGAMMIELRVAGGNGGNAANGGAGVVLENRKTSATMMPMRTSAASPAAPNRMIRSGGGDRRSGGCDFGASGCGLFCQSGRGVGSFMSYPRTPAVAIPARSGNGAIAVNARLPSLQGQTQARQGSRTRCPPSFGRDGEWRKRRQTAHQTSAQKKTA